MLSKLLIRASVLAAMLATGCSAMTPWSRSPEAIPNETNLAFTLENNLVFLNSVAINNRTGHFLFGSATPRTIIDRRLVDEFGGPSHAYALMVTAKETLPFKPLFLDLGSAGDAIIGYETLQPNAVTIDYRVGLLTLQKEGIYTSMMSVYRFTGMPSIDVEVNGTRQRAIVDTSSPDTIVLPAPATSRGKAHVVVAGIDFGQIDVRFGAVEQPRLGNRLLSKFLISIDYHAGTIGVWRDPRIR
jgi:hypothetical protein